MPAVSTSSLPSQHQSPRTHEEKAESRLCPFKRAYRGNCRLLAGGGSRPRAPRNTVFNALRPSFCLSPKDQRARPC